MRVFVPLLLALVALSSVSSEVVTPNNVVCYQEIVGSNANYATLSSSIATWAANLQQALGLPGDVHQYVDWAQVPDRNSFENGCDGPYATVADVFVHIQANGDNFDTISAALESFISNNPWAGGTNIACAARSVVTFLPGCGKVPATVAPTRGSSPTQGPTRASNPTSPPVPNNTVCYQAIVGSNATQSQVESSISAWASLLESTLGLSGDVHQWVDWALVPDRNSFENGCNGPFATVEDVFVHISASADNFDSVSASLEAFIAAHPLTDQANIVCAARSVTTFLPTCGRAGGNPTQPATEAPTRANSPTQAPTTKAPTTKAPTTKAPTTKAPTTQAPTRANSPTQAPTTQAPTRANAPPTPNNVVCYQAVVGSSGTQSQVEASISAWASKLESALGLSGDVHQFVDWALVPDRTSFENGCNGPYATVEDVFVHIQADAASFASVSQSLEAFIAANPISSQANIACAARSVTDFLPTCGPSSGGSPTRGNSPTQAPQNATSAPTNATTSAPTSASNATSAPTQFVPPPRGNSTVQQPTPNNILCYQEIVGSNSDYASVSASIGAWAAKLESALGLSGDVHLYVDWAQVKDRTGFENGCNGPYTTVADVFVHIPTQTNAYDGLSSQLENFISANPWTSQPAIACGARSVVTFIPGCGKIPSGPASVTTVPPTTGPTSPATQAPTSPATQAPTSPATQAPTNGPTSGATTSAPTTPGTSAPTTAPTSPPPPSPANVVCYQAIFGSNVAFSTVTVDIQNWANKLQAALGLSGDIHQIVDWAQTNRTSFENCPGPYNTVADVFVHIPTTSGNFDAVSLQLENFILANPLTSNSNIVCAARSVTTFLPTCGKIPSGGAPPAGSGLGTVCYQSIVGSLSGSYSQVSAELSAWAQKLYNALGLTGPIENQINFAQVPDRNSFENGCNGPYTTVADLFVHISTTSANYNTVAANVESFVASNPLVSSSTGGVINCSARSVTSQIPICGNSLVSSQSEVSSPQTTTNAAPPTSTITTSIIVTLIASIFFFIKY